MSTSMEMRRCNNNPLMPARVVLAFDASKDHDEVAFRETVRRITLRGDILRRGDTFVVLGVMHKLIHPLGYPVKASVKSFSATNFRAIKDEVSRKVNRYVKMLVPSTEECEDEGVDIEVKITWGTPREDIVLQEVLVSNTTWVILDRSLMRDLRHYLKLIPCKVAMVLDNLSTEVIQVYTPDNVKGFYSISKPIPSLALQEIPDCVVEQGEIQIGETISLLSPVMTERRRSTEQQISDASILCTACGTKTEPDIKDSMKFSFTEIQVATSNFSEENLVGEGGYGHVYKGKLKDGQLVAAKVRKEANMQGFVEFLSDIRVLSFVHHKNLVMLLGYCCKENHNILVYEYICNKSLEWHLFDNMANVLDWHRRYAIAIGIAQGLHFLHEQCRRSPIIHHDIKPSNILLTHDFVPMLGDTGITKWKISNDDVQTRILGTLGYLAPEYAAGGIFSVKTDVYAFGIVLVQLVSGRKAIDSGREDNNQSLREWAMALIKRLALHELVDERLGESYDTYELYCMAKAAYMCVQTDPEMRPSMGEVLRLLEGDYRIS